MMEDIVQVIVSAFPWLPSFVDTAQVVITAIPSYFEELVSRAYVTIWALPSTYVVPGIVGALVLFLFLFGADHMLFEEEES